MSQPARQAVVPARDCPGCGRSPSVRLCDRHRDEFETWSTGSGLLARDYLAWSDLPVDRGTAGTLLADVHSWAEQRPGLTSPDGPDLDTWIDQQLATRTRPGRDGSRLATPAAAAVADVFDLDNRRRAPVEPADEPVQQSLLAALAGLGVDGLDAPADFAVAARFVGVPDALIDGLWPLSQRRVAVTADEVAPMADGGHLDVVDGLLAWRQIFCSWSDVTSRLAGPLGWLRQPGSAEPLLAQGLADSLEHAAHWHAAAATALLLTAGSRFGPKREAEAVTLPLIRRWREHRFDVPDFEHWQSVFDQPRPWFGAADMIWPGAPALLRVLLDMNVDERGVQAWFRQVSRNPDPANLPELLDCIRAGTPLDWWASFGRAPQE